MPIPDDAGGPEAGLRFREVERMSVMGELARHLDALIGELDLRAEPGREALGRTLRAARPADPAAVSDSARRILDALVEAGLAGTEEAKRQAAPSALEEAAGTVAKLCRIVLGR